MALPRKQLVDALVNAFDPITFDRMLSDHLNLRRDRLVAATGLAGFDAIASRVVEIADEKSWVIDLIAASLKARPGNPQLLAFIAANSPYDPANQPATPPNYFRSVFIRSGRVFLKREDFRELLQKIGAPDESRVLAVDGDRYTGKTYSVEFLTFLRENEPAWKLRNQDFININMDDRVFEPEDLALTIGNRLGLNPATMPPDKGEQAPRRIPALIDWLTLGLQQSHIDIWWLVLDGFMVNVHPSATHDLIRAIMDAVDKMGLVKLRLVLLNYGKHLDLDTAFILTESIDPIDEQKDLPQFFRYVYTRSGKKFDDADINQSVTKLLGQVEEQIAKRKRPDERMKLLNIGLTKAAKELLK